MTLIVAGGNSESVVIAADTRLSWDGRLIDDQAPKVSGFRFYDGTTISAYTGLARYGDFETKKWFLDRMVDIAKPWTKMMEALGEVNDQITSEFASNSALRALPPLRKRLSILFGGFVDKRPSVMLISNFEDHNGEFPVVKDEFVLTSVVAQNASFSWSGIFGARGAVSATDHISLNGMVAEKKSPPAIKGKCHSMVLKASANPKSGGTVGSSILTATLTNDNKAASWFSFDGTVEKLLLIDQFTSMADNLGAFAVRDITVSTPDGFKGRSKKRGRSGKHIP